MLHWIVDLEGHIGFNPLLSASGHLSEKLCPPLFRPFCSSSPLCLKRGLSNVEWSEMRMQINASFKLLSQGFSLTHWFSHYFFFSDENRKTLGVVLEKLGTQAV